MPDRSREPTKDGFPGAHELQARLREHGIYVPLNNLRSQTTRRIVSPLLDRVEAASDAVEEVEKLRGVVSAMSILVEELQTKVITDPLTGLYNRRHFEKELGVMLDRQRRKKTERTPITAAMLDVNWLKRINDEISHTAGDAVLQHVALTLQQYFPRQADILARGGTKADEFPIALYETTAEEAEIKLQEVVNDINNTPFYYKGKRIPVSVAYGIHEITSDDTVASIRTATSKNMERNKEEMKKNMPAFNELVARYQDDAKREMTRHIEPVRHQRKKDHPRIRTSRRKPPGADGNGGIPDL